MNFKRIKNALSGINFVKKAWRFLLYSKIALYDFRRFWKFSVCMDDSLYALKYKIMMNLHVIEKGLTMPSMRADFGDAAFKELDNLIKRFFDLQKEPSFEVKYAAAVIKQYAYVHKSQNLKISDWKEKIIEDLCERVPGVERAAQIEISKAEYFNGIENLPFDRFSESRHSVRNFCGEVGLNDIKDAIKLACNAPSACNRQPCSAHIISGRELLKKCLALQNGNRGFGQNADKLIILTGDITSVAAKERNDIFFNGGIFLMNLLYALHFKKIGACTLNWSVDPKTDKTLRAMLNIPNRETIFCFILCGDVPDKFKLALSKRRTPEDIYVVHS